MSSEFEIIGATVKVNGEAALPSGSREYEHGDVVHLVIQADVKEVSFPTDKSGAMGLGKRIRAWSKANNTYELDNIFWLPQSVDLLDAEQARQLTELMDATQPVLVVIDTLARSIPGADENAAQDMGRLIEAVDRIRRRTRATVLLVHHSTKEGSTARGSGALKGAVDTEIEVKKEGSTVALFCRKQKDAEEFLPRSLQLVVMNDSCALSGSPQSSPQRDLSGLLKEAFLRVGVRTGISGGGLRDLAIEELGVGKTKAYELINDLLNEGFIVNRGTSRYAHYEVASPGVRRESASSEGPRTRVRPPGGSYRDPRGLKEAETIVRELAATPFVLVDLDRLNPECRQAINEQPQGTQRLLWRARQWVEVRG